VTRLGERDCNGERDRMDAGTLMDCDWVTGAPVQYDSTLAGWGLGSVVAAGSLLC
jgi:hypothetical protein